MKAKNQLLDLGMGAARASAKAFRFESENLPMPDDPHAWLDDTEQKIEALPDTHSQKKLMRAYLAAARRHLPAGDEMAVKYHLLLLVRHWTHVPHTKFVDAPKQEKRDKLRETMLATLLCFCEKHGRRPSASELAKELPTDGRYVQEVGVDGLGELYILWKRPNGKEEKTYFQDFKKRYTRLLNKQPEIKKRYPKKK